MGKALYRAHRPKKLSEVVGQEHVTTALDRALKKGTISHAYLLTGPRGVGKTTIARILAHEINSLPYEDDATHLDIIEIDAASNRRIDEIRDIRDKVHIAPAAAKFKVYIIDEVHMLTKEAFNALLKTLEEPPAHVVFVLATTEVHRLPETIISRTQRFAFKPVDLPKVVAHLRTIARAEKIDISDDALGLIAEHGGGSFRDSISLLDQVRNTGDKVTLANVQALLGIAPAELIDRIIQAVSACDLIVAATCLQHMHDGGYEPAQIARQLGSALRARLLEGAQPLAYPALMELLAKLVEVPASSDPKSYLEIALLDAALAGDGGKAASVHLQSGLTAQEKPQSKAAPSKVMPEHVQAKPPTVNEPHPSAFQRIQREQQTADDSDIATTESDAVLDKKAWTEVLAAIKTRHNTLFSIVRVTTPHFEPGIVTLECGYAFHQKRLSEKRNKELLATIIHETTGHNLRLQCIVGEVTIPDNTPLPAVLPPADEQVHAVVSSSPPAPAPVPPQNEAVKAISDIFGGAEVLQS